MSQLARDRARERYANKLALRRLEACGYVRRKSHDGKISFSVTAEGKRTLRGLYAQSSRVVMQPKEWDGMWRVVTYDFPEEQEQRSARNALRHVLSKSLFLQLQKSVWIFPYDSPLLADLFANNPIVRKHAVFMKVAHISSVESCKRHFHLS
jgi:DNA-binding transcriptional regulator PaaX